MSKKLVLRVALILAVVIPALVAVMWFVPVFKVGDIRVEGIVNTEAEAVIDATGISVGDNLLRVDSAGAATAVAELPWVKTVSVSRSLPNVIKVSIVEREAVGYVNYGDGDRLIDRDAKPIIIGTPPPGAVQIKDVKESDSATLSAAVSVVNEITSLDSNLIGLISNIKAPSAFDISINLNDGRTVYWGSAENNHDKAIAMKTVLSREGKSWNISSPSLVTVS